MQGLDQRDMATVFILRLDTRTGRGEYVRIGHLPGLVRSPDCEVTDLYGKGSPPMGTVPDLRVEVERVELEPGSTVFLYTDGLIESRERPIDEDIRRLCDVLADAPSAVEECLDHVVEKLAPADPFDDVAILAMRITG
jgi:serine phosphatase RsbU (regulator of sigma subunit)